MTPTEAAKVLRTWADMADKLDTASDLEASRDTLEQRCTELKAKLDTIVADTEKARAVQEKAAAAYMADTNAFVATRRATLSDIESVHKLSISQAEQHQRELMDGLEKKRVSLKSEVDALDATKSSLTADVANLRALIADMAKR